jgi:hypothetical protein
LGRWSWHQKKLTTDDVKSLDIRLLHRKGALEHRGIATLSWSNGDGDTVGSMQVEVTVNTLVLRYNYRDRGGLWEQIREIVRMDRTPCNYGGCRVWVRCPGCTKRVAILYGAGLRFLCRHCYQLPYATQNVDDMFRIARKVHKIRRRLSAPADMSEPIVFKSKGMHWRTFERLRWQEAMAQEAYLNVFAAALRSLGIRPRTISG